MILNYRLNAHSGKPSKFPIIFMHGLFGNLSNFNTLSQELNKKFYKTLQIDLRNHGKSPHHISMNYTVMAQDILDILDSLSISQCIAIGHSMGGKVAMTLSQLAPNRIIKMVIIDIAPITYITQEFHKIFSAIHYVNTLHLTNRNETYDIMKKFISDHNIICFLLKSFKHGRWDFNIQNIQKNYSILNKWEHHIPWAGDILFIRGDHSSYIKKCYYKNIYQQFPKASIHTINNAGHWVHVEKHHEILNIIDCFLS